MSQDPDSLTASSRGFYERSKGKVALSILVAAASMMLLGFCSVAAGQSQAYSYIKSANSGGNTDVLAAYQSLVSGYGFGSFVYILAFLLLLASAIYISPLMCGTLKEKNIIKTPSESNAYSSYSDAQDINRA